MDTKLSPANMVIVVGAAGALIGSFLHVADGDNAWSSGAFPLFTLPAILGVLMATHVLVTAFAGNVRLPGRIGGFEWDQVHLAAGIWAAFMMVCLLIGRIGVTLARVNVSPSRGIGFWLMLLGALALAAGAALRGREPTPTVGG